MRRDRKRIDFGSSLVEKSSKQRLAEIPETETGHITSNCTCGRAEQSRSGIGLCCLQIFLAFQSHLPNFAPPLGIIRIKLGYPKCARQREVQVSQPQCLFSAAFQDGVKVLEIE